MKASKRLRDIFSFYLTFFLPLDLLLLHFLKVAKEQIKFIWVFEQIRFLFLFYGQCIIELDFGLYLSCDNF